MEECPTCAAVHPDSHPSIEEGMPEDYICPDPFHKRPLKQPLPGTGVTRWADRAQYTSEPATSTAPVVTLINATPDPLGSIAALTAMYKGRVVRSLAELSDDDRRTAFDDMSKTELNGALESVRFQFLVENVTRSWTHQAVRTRTAFFAQESMRFAVVGDWASRVALPPTLAGSTGEYPKGEADLDLEIRRGMWDSAVQKLERTYADLVNSGMPAEDARGLMPHAMTTRLMVSLDLRTLLHQAGLRLCTQAQFEWRLVMAGMVNAIRSYGATPYPGRPSMYTVRDDGWQFDIIANALKPVCYQEGRCTFMASMDRGCTIRERVNQNAAEGRPSSEWHLSTTRVAPGGSRYTGILAINPAEWAADPGAARADGGGFVGEGAR